MDMIVWQQGKSVRKKSKSEEFLGALKTDWSDYVGSLGRSQAIEISCGGGIPSSGSLPTAFAQQWIVNRRRHEATIHGVHY